jgi:hypothetical protein
MFRGPRLFARLLSFGAFACVVAASTAGCSLNFSNSQIPIDAALDAPYTADECAYKEPNDTPAMAAMITPADTGPAAICENDVDYYEFAVPDMTKSVSIEILFTNSPTGDLDLKLFDSTGTSLLAASLGFTDNEQIVCPGQSPFCAALAAGNYIFEVFPAVAGDVNFYNIALTITPD